MEVSVVVSFVFVFVWVGLIWFGLMILRASSARQARFYDMIRYDTEFKRISWMDGWMLAGWQA